MRLFHYFILFLCHAAHTMTMVDSFYHFQTIHIVKNNYHNFFKEAISTEIYDKQMSFSVKNRCLIDKNKMVYVNCLKTMQQLVPMINKKSYITIRNIHIESDRFLIEWVFFCNTDITISGSSLYVLNEHGDIQNHILNVSKFEVSPKLSYYIHPIFRITKRISSS